MKFGRKIICALILSAVFGTTVSAKGSDVTISFDANGGEGTMEDVNVKAGKLDSYTLPANEFSRYGYVFRGWNVDKNGTQTEIDEQGKLSDASDSGAAIDSDSDGKQTLYALWEPQLYIIHFDKGGKASGDMDDMYAIYDEKTPLESVGFGRADARFTRWKTADGKNFANRAKVLNLLSGNTESEKIVTVDSGKPKDKDYSFRSTQGSCVFEEDGKMYVVTAASINDAAYNSGDLSHYETVITKFDVETGKAVKRVRNLKFDHANGLAYDSNNGHIYVAEGGTCDGYPSGVMELDGNLKKVKEYSFPLLTHIWGIAYSNGYFYVIGRNDDSRNSFCVLNEDMQTLSITQVDDYYSQNFSSQGIAADDTFIYAVSAGFKTYEWKSSQRINVFTHDGEYVGVWTIDIPYEAEDITILDDYAYITTNEHAKSTLYKTSMPKVTLTAQWELYK